MFLYTLQFETYLVPIQLATGNFSLALLLEGENDQSHEDVKKKEGEDDYKTDVINGITWTVINDRTHIFLCCVHGALHSTEKRTKTKIALVSFSLFRHISRVGSRAL